MNPITVGGFLVNLLFSILRDKREMRERAKRMRDLDRNE